MYELLKERGINNYNYEALEGIKKIFNNFKTTDAPEILELIKNKSNKEIQFLLTAINHYRLGSFEDAKDKILYQYVQFLRETNGTERQCRVKKM